MLVEVVRRQRQRGIRARSWRTIAIGEAGSQARVVAGDMLATGRQTAQAVSHQFDEQPFLAVLAGFGLGYIAGLLIHGRR